MTALKFFVVVLNIAGFTRGDTEVTCYFGESCTLPCSFSYGPEVVIHWIQKTQPEFRAHSYYYNKDQLDLQDQRFRGRTSLFRDEISRGNASLLLTGVMVQDRGRYQCYTSTVTGNKDTFINLSVDAPVQRVDIEEMQNGTITCRSDGIFPEPTLSWSSSPRAESHNLKVQRTEQQLFNISSVLILSDSDTDLDYSCTVSTPKNKKKATLMKAAAVNTSGTETTIPCSTSALTNLIWRFNRSQIILTRSGPEDPYRPSEEWRQHVKTLSKTGSLTLKDLSPNHFGTYTCEFSSAEETHIKNTFLHRADKPRPSAGYIAWVLVGVVAGLLVVAVIGFKLYRKVLSKKQDSSEGRNKGHNKTEESKNPQETQGESFPLTATETTENSQKTEEDKK